MVIWKRCEKDGVDKWINGVDKKDKMEKDKREKERTFELS
jgi:hypothetical protein